MDTETIIKRKRCIDLSLAACRKRQSPRTTFVHSFEGFEEHTDTIPLYENFCFVLALYRQKTVESVLEGKDLLEKLLAFQAPDGNFPIYLHEFPACKSSLQRLKIAPLLIQLERHFSSVISSELKEKLSLARERCLSISLENLSDLWKFRYDMCKEGHSTVEIKPEKNWIHWLISKQLTKEPILLEAPAFHPQLQVLSNPRFSYQQEGLEPQPHLLEWLLAEQRGGISSARLLQDHPSQIQLAAFWPFSDVILQAEENLYQEESCIASWASHLPGDVFRFLWKGSKVGSIVLPGKVPSEVSLIGKREWEILFDLPENVDLTNNQLFEVAFYCSALPEMDWKVGGQKATTFSLGDTIFLISPQCHFSISFELLSGTGDFCGHICKANRLTQIKSAGYEAYDWQIGLRTLRRSAKVRLRAVCKSLL